MSLPRQPTAPHRNLNPEANFPPLSVVAYLSDRGPVVARTLPGLEALRARPDYESCMVTMTDAQMAIVWDFSLAAYPRCPTTQPIRVSDNRIAVEWDPDKLAALIRGSQQDLDALDARLTKTERDFHDMDRIIDNARRRRRRDLGECPDYRALAGARGYGHRSASAAENTMAPKYEGGSRDVYKLREVFSAAQADVGRLLGRLAYLEIELQHKRQQAMALV